MYRAFFKGEIRGCCNAEAGEDKVEILIFGGGNRGRGWRGGGGKGVNYRTWGGFDTCEGSKGFGAVFVVVSAHGLGF